MSEPSGILRYLNMYQLQRPRDVEVDINIHVTQNVSAWVLSN